MLSRGEVAGRIEDENQNLARQELERFIGPSASLERTLDTVAL
jgi:hypothetical protein